MAFGATRGKPQLAGKGTDMTPFFAIIIPVYNTAPYLRECLDSVLAQTFSDWEAICVDDGSTDGSGSILDNYAAMDSRFCVFHQANAGVSAARNKALDNATGDWVGFLDADDIWRPWMLKTIHDCITCTNADWIRMTDCSCRFKTLHPPEMASPRAVTSCLAPNATEFGWKAISNDATPFLNFFKVECIDKTRFPVGIRFREDAIFGFEMASKVHSIAVTTAPGYCRRERMDSATSSPRLRDDTTKLLTSYLDLWEKVRIKGHDISTHESIVAASTRWVEKDVRQWLLLCPDRTRNDAIKVTRLIRLLLAKGIISRNLAHPCRRRLRWKCYLATGYWWFLIANRHNLLGRPQPRQTQV